MEKVQRLNVCGLTILWLSLRYSPDPVGNIRVIPYVYLDTEERRRFAQQSHEYLMDQLQHNGTETLSLKPALQESRKMNFNHPVKEVVWVFQRSVNAPQNGGNVATNDWLMLANKNQCFKSLVSIY